MKKLSLKLVAVLAVLGILLAGLASCSHSDSLTIYSGRSEALIGPLIAQWEKQSGIDVEVRYGNSTDLALLLNEEGSKTPADIFISQSPGALSFLASQDLLAQIPQSLSDKIRPQFQSANSTWLGLSGRERVLVYNTDLVSEDELPLGVAELTDAIYKGRVAVAPNNSSFQDFITAMKSAWGLEATEEWLKGMADNDAPNYSKNSAIVTAVVSGEVDMGLVNHYYLLRELEENPGAPALNYYFPSDDIGSLLIITAGAIIAESNKKTEAAQLLEFLVSQDSQTFFVQETKEYSLLPDAAAPAGVPNLDAFASGNSAGLQLLDERLEETLRETLTLIENSGITNQ